MEANDRGGVSGEAQRRRYQDASGSWKEILQDLRLWVGILTGVSSTALGMLAFGLQVIEAPTIASMADARADTALRMAEANRERILDHNRNIRIVFCTKEDWLSAEAAAQLECWRVRSGAR